ncbi:hypothetical protein [Actinomycetospora cinnamomea]|uniref:Uncharacterized protein n=1 Tax=Actinomycetospora cinnamomea TaxID=663609 RepID=A0A2U1FHY0_9PSEU|nr:hypothetical protein [Actinomycetospora cinnamomea]PVZ11761.1 hypothetical protein C8D89_10391 [Actinomycetospora cinnamomea]
MATIVFGVLVVAAFMAATRYGADSRAGGDPTGRDPVWTADPTREHTPLRDLALVRALSARWAAYLRICDSYERSLRPWETPPAPVERTRHPVA